MDLQKAVSDQTEGGRGHHALCKWEDWMRRDLLKVEARIWFDADHAEASGVSAIVVYGAKHGSAQFAIVMEQLDAETDMDRFTPVQLLENVTRDEAVAFAAGFAFCERIRWNHEIGEWEAK